MSDNWITRPRVERDALLKRLRELAASDDPDSAHVEADELLLNYIRDLEVLEAYGAIRRWYS